ncbi:hypothetical protein C8N40_111139 [Pontibacter mucosus]|uniref:Uncharacterized protein n=1 Tax=Pontibacter mucosus TaxID=1649266 RepID=A0A2T5YD89_9BACT|nr:hypothetical protein [Pontibacter mucosus]PTX14474.1 hypothetical protein C8N40_111139 [Pontibacter mucosus]
MKELWLRLKEPLNLFWKRALIIFGTIAAFAVSVTEVLPLFLHDELVPDEWRTTVRIVYGVALGITIAARLTVRDTQELKQKKAQPEP